MKELCNAEFLSLSFDESLNKQTQTQQMDIAVLYVYEGKSNIRYLTSQFLGCATAEDLERELKEGIKDVINQEKLSQISMDGPNVNLKLLRNLTTERQEGGLPHLLDCGICNQHTFHNAFKVVV